MIKYIRGLNLDYFGLNNVTIVDTDTYKGYQWYLGQLNNHKRLKEFDDVCNTNGYVIIKPGQPGYDEYRYEDQDIIACHGDITFEEFDKDHNRIIGFDTHHGIERGWTNDKLESECKKIINQLVKSNN